MPAFGKTRLQIVNAVLPRLREAEVATTSTTVYSLFIAKLLDSVKTEIEQAHQWRDLRNTFALTCTVGTTLYSFTSSGQYARIMDMWNTSVPQQMALGSFSDFNQKFFGVTTVETGHPTQYLPAGLDSSFDTQVDIWPSPSTTDAIKVNLYVPEPDPPTDATVILCPNQVLIEGIIALALAERGDDNGTAVDKQTMLYEQMLRSAIAADTGHDNSETDWIIR